MVTVFSRIGGATKLRNFPSVRQTIEVVVSEEVARDRVLGRARGADDNNEVFDNRMQVYTDPLALIQNFYEAKEMLVKIDGERTIEAIVDEMDIFISSKI